MTIEIEDRYLGDGVYGLWDGFQVWVYVSNGFEKHSFVPLEDDTIRSLVEYRDDIEKRLLAANQTPTATSTDGQIPGGSDGKPT